MTIQAIETRYNGYRFRSRLEARWAVFFDVLGLEWLYEHEGFDLGQLGKYLPDFWFPELECFGEVKPTTFTEMEYQKCEALPFPCLVLDGMPQVEKGYFCIGAHDDLPEMPTGYKVYLDGELYGRVMLEPSVSKRRLWFLFGETPGDYYLNDTPERAAKSARFEHGERGQWIPRKTWPGLDAMDHAAQYIAELQY